MSKFVSASEADCIRDHMQRCINASTVSVTDVSRILQCSRNTVYVLLVESSRIKKTYAKRWADKFRMDIADLAESVVSDSHGLVKHLRAYKEDTTMYGQRICLYNILHAVGEYLLQRFGMGVTSTTYVAKSGMPTHLSWAITSSKGVTSRLVTTVDVTQRGTLPIEVMTIDNEVVARSSLRYADIDKIAKWLNNQTEE